MENATTIYVFGVSSFEESYLKKIYMALGCKNSKNILSMEHRPEKETLKIVLATMKEIDLHLLKSHDHISIDKQTLPIVINEEIFSETKVTFSFELFEIVKVIQDRSSNTAFDSTQLFENLKSTRDAEGGPWVLTGTVSNLCKFQEKVNSILGFKSSSSVESKSVACSTDVVQNDATGRFSPFVDVVPKTNDVPSSPTSNASRDQSDVVFSSVPMQMQASHLPSDELRLKIGNSLKISIYVGDITKEHVSAIVNPVYESKETNNHLKRTVAQSVQQNARKTYIVGDTDYYVANGLACDRVIDVNLPSYDPSDGDPEAVLAPVLQNCYTSCINRAKYLEISSIAFQPLACELFDDSVSISAICATKAVLNSINQDALGPVKDIRFVTGSRDVAQIFVKHFGRLIDELKQFADVEVICGKGKPASTATEQTKSEFTEKEPSTSGGRQKGFSSTPPGFECFPVPKKLSSHDADCVAEDSDKMEVDDCTLDGDKIKSHAIDKSDDKTAAVADAAVAHVEDCSICLEIFDANCQTKVLSKCQHKFHVGCIDEWMQTKNTCPLCQTLYGMPKGNQPDGTMLTRFINNGYRVPGFKSVGYIEILYQFPGGIQGPNHPFPGTPYSGTSRVAYLPGNERGQLIAKLLSKAFDCGLVFTVGTSVTTGKPNTVVWNNIHHKTTLSGGPYGYPDPTYLDRVEAELKAAGIDKSML